MVKGVRMPGGSKISAFAVQSRSGDSLYMSFLDSEHNQPSLQVQMEVYDEYSILVDETVLDVDVEGTPGNWTGVAGPFDMSTGRTHFFWVHEIGSTRELAAASV